MALLENLPLHHFFFRSLWEQGCDTRHRRPILSVRNTPGRSIFSPPPAEIASPSLFLCSQEQTSISEVTFMWLFAFKLYGTIFSKISANQQWTTRGSTREVRDFTYGKRPTTQTRTPLISTSLNSVSKNPPNKTTENPLLIFLDNYNQQSLKSCYKKSSTLVN